jgi:hypothetical protein
MTQIFCSDLEGADLRLFEQGEKSITVLGDLFDSTNINSTTFLETKSFNLRNMQMINKKRNINLIFGNRDLNKIKCLILNKLNMNTLENMKNIDERQDGLRELIDNFNNGNIVLSLQNYERLKMGVNNLKKIWRAQMSNWYTFWNPFVGKKKNWVEETNYSSNPFLMRFNEIFGADNIIGTMSAQNLLKTIPYEIGIDSNKKDIDDYNAFIVLAIFNSLLSNNFTCTSLDLDFNIYLEKKNNIEVNSNFCNGWLRKIYLDEKNNVCDLIISETENILFLLSHGGLTKNVLNQSNSLKKFKEKLMDNNNENLKNILTDATIFWENKKGGYHDYVDDSKKYNLKTVIMKLKQINSEFKLSIQNCLMCDVFSEKEKDNEIKANPSIDMLFLLIMTSPFNCTRFNDLLKDNKKINCEDIISSNQISPIMAGYAVMRNEFFYIEDYEVYQIYGHAPVGYSSTIDMFENGCKTFLINLDSSNSFIGTSNNSGNSKSFLQINLDINPNEILVNSIINISKDMKKTVYDESQIESYNEVPENIHFVVNKEDDENNNNIKICNNIRDPKFMDLLRISQKYNFHGFVGDKIVFTINSPKKDNFNKILFYVDANNLVSMGNLLKTKELGTEETKGETKVGGNDLYGGKYLKYKKKYLQLKNKYK